MAGCRRAAALAALLSSIVVVGASGQTLSVVDPWEEYLRLLQISGRVDSLGSFTVRPSLGLDALPAEGEGMHPWVGRIGEPPTASGGSLGFAIVPPEMRTYANSRFPVGRNDGAVWQGRGLTTALDAGGVLTWRALTIEVRPLLLFHQNAGQDLAPVLVPGMPVYAYPWRKIDWPQQFGPDAYWRLDPGQSQVRVDAWGASAGVSTQNLSWGPAVRNPIIMSNNAAGIPHAFLGTDGPLGIGIGDLEGRWIWGRLQQSDWFDPAVPTDDRFITAIVLTYSPSFLHGLSVGLTRVFYELVPPGGVPLEDYFAVFSAVRKKSQATPDNPEGNDEYDQLLSIFGRWVLPTSGFEVFWEWARNDHSWELRDFLLEPEHSQAYTLGLVKSLELSRDRLLSLGFELSHLERGTTFQVRSNGTYYEHGIVTQGYTQRGQIIGAGIGPGGNAQALWLDLYAPWGRAGTWLERQVHNNDAYYEWAEANDRTYCCHDVSFHWGSQALFFVDDWELGAGVILTREMNRWYYGLDLWNLNLSASARWRP